MAQSVTTVSPEVTIDNTLGALFVGFAMACCIYGILLSQIYTYLGNYPLDRPVYKFIVLLILTLETVDQALIGQIYYHYGISNFSNPLTLIEGAQTWFVLEYQYMNNIKTSDSENFRSFILQQTLGSVVGTMVKISFALRVWRFSQRNFWITGLIVSVDDEQEGMSILNYILDGSCYRWLVLGNCLQCKIVSLDRIRILHSAQKFVSFARFMLPDVFSVVRLRVLGTISLGVGVLTDIVTALALCYFLNKLRTGYRQSDSLVSSLIKYAINTGALTSVISVTTVVLYNLMPDNLIFIAVFFILSKLYAISFMATLNTRRVVRGRGTDKQNTTTNRTNMFHLGTRVPSMGPTDMDGWETAYTTTSATKQEIDQHRSIPLNTFAPPNTTFGKYSTEV
ncbi:hypothetical protein C8R41DRAFT_868221 [Lentinula lateritia]|uniref:DUF6534 domain-containing protein n=1 Tax=Lentinula lateritia TaxID=40482 RepID=A0ABQ8VBU3_9AGAR|nr:hypothetical protein C8R41DRAFT_868221 [Lentinula lateritia]